MNELGGLWRVLADKLANDHRIGCTCSQVRDQFVDKGCHRLEMNSGQYSRVTDPSTPAHAVDRRDDSTALL